MSNSPRISVIIPSLNHGEYVERAICSVLDQGYENLELIVIDGGSDDDSVAIIDRYAADLACWRSEMNNGPADAIDLGLTQATGEIVGILHADDLYLPGALDAVADAMSRKGKAEWVVGHVLRIDGRDAHLGQQLSEAPSAHHWHEHLTQEHGTLPASATFYKRSLFDRFGGFDTKLQHAYAFDFHARLLWKGKEPRVVDVVMAAQREHVTAGSARSVVASGLEHVEVALRHGERLTMPQRFALWQACDEKRRIYAIAEAELVRSDARSFLWEKLLRRPWWLASAQYRESLLRGVLEPIQAPRRKAA